MKMTASPLIRFAVAQHLKTAFAVLRACNKTLNGFSHQSKKDLVVFFYSCPKGEGFEKGALTEVGEKPPAVKKSLQF